MGSLEELQTEQASSKPPGLRCLEQAGKSSLSFRGYQVIVLVVTFFAYASYHATRKTTSVVKSALDPASSKVGLSSWLHTRLLGPSSGRKNGLLAVGWAPFNGADGTQMLGEIDVAFLSIYSIGMYCAGHLGDRLDLRIFLTVGMVGTGLFTALFGAGYWLSIHNFYYFLLMQMLAGLFQSTGWPSVVAVVGNWFGKRKRGLIMGIWNAHTSVGNISGSLMAAAMLKFGWGWSFVVPGVVMAFVGFVVFLILPVSPDIVGAQSEEDKIDESLMKNNCTESLLVVKSEVKEKAVGFLEAWKIPGVAPFALCLFFSKLVAYTFLYWLPFYISHTGMSLFPHVPCFLKSFFLFHK